MAATRPKNSSASSTPADALLCHHRRDRASVRELAEWLRGRGWVMLRREAGRLDESKELDAKALVVVWGPFGFDGGEEANIKRLADVRRQGRGGWEREILVLLPGAGEPPSWLRGGFADHDVCDLRDEGMISAAIDGLERCLAGKADAPLSPHATAKNNYLAQLAEEHEWIDLAGLLAEGDAESPRLPLQEMFISLHAVRVWRTRQMGERLTASEFLNNDRIVLLGDSGGGKTTLLRYLARTLATHNAQPPLGVHAGKLPVFVRLGEYDEWCRGGPKAGLMDFIAQLGESRRWPVSGALLDAEARRGGCLFLLDGLDEIGDPPRRGQMVRRVRRFADEFHQCPLIVTSRSTGYRDAPFPNADGFLHFALCPPDEEEVRRFAKQWRAALHGGGHSAELADRLLAQEPLRRMATSPLILTLMVALFDHK